MTQATGDRVMRHGFQRAGARLGAWVEPIPATLTLAAVVLWLVALPAIEPDRMQAYGLLSVLPAAFYVALGALTVAFVLAVRSGRRHLPVAHVLLLIAFLHATPAVAYGTLRYAWAWKHVGVVDYIERLGAVDPTSAFLDAYHNWPGFFGAAALLGETGSVDTLQVALWAPVAVNVLLAGALYSLFRTLTRDMRLVWLATWLFFVANWVGQDYFAPQAFTFFVYLVVVTICLRCFRPSPGEAPAWLAGRWPLRGRAFDSDGVTDRLSPAQRAGAAAIVVLLVAAVAATHQLTPLMLAIALIALTMLGRLTVPVLAGYAVLVAGVWIAFPAAPFVQDSLGEVVDGLGRFGDNTRETLLDLARASSDQVVIAYVGRSLTVAICLAALAGMARRWRSGQRDLSAIALALAPFALLALSSYGGEVAFRSYLFALPFLAFFGAGLLLPTEQRPLSQRRSTAIAGLLLVVVGAFLFPYYGKERQNYFHESEIAAARVFHEQAPDSALLVGVNTAKPWAFERYERYSYAWLERLTPAELERFLAAPRDGLDGLARAFAAPQVWLLVTESQIAAAELSGTLSRDRIDRLVRQLQDVDGVRVVSRSARATLLALTPDRKEAS